MRIKNVFKCATMWIILSVCAMTTSNAATPELLVEDGYVSLSKYVFFSSATLEKKVIDLKDESLSRYKYIVSLNSSEKDKKNIIEIFENGAGAYINGQYIHFKSAKVSGFSVPSRIKIKEKNGEIYLPTSFFVDYLDSQIIEEGKLSVNKLPEIEEGIVGEFNDLSSFATNKISDSSSEKTEEVKDKLDDNTINNQTNNNVNNTTNSTTNNQGNSGNSSTSQGGNSNNNNTGSNNNSNSTGSGNSNQGSNNSNNNNSNTGSNSGSSNSGNTGGNNTGSNGSNNAGNNNTENSGDNSSSSGDNTNDSNNNGNNVNEDNSGDGNEENENNGQVDGIESEQSNTQGASQNEITKLE